MCNNLLLYRKPCTIDTPSLGGCDVGSCSSVAGFIKGLVREKMRESM